MIGNRTDERNEGRTRARRPQTISIRLTDRGQTTQDFAVGIGIFLLVIAFVFSFLPSIITPFDSSVGGAEKAQANRIADLIVHNESVSTETPNEINKSAFEEHYNDSNLASQLGLRANGDGVVYDNVNITIVSLKGDFELTGGEDYEDQPAKSSARIITVVDENSTGECDPACRLVVRIW